MAIVISQVNQKFDKFLEVGQYMICVMDQNLGFDRIDTLPLEIKDIEHKQINNQIRDLDI